MTLTIVGAFGEAHRPHRHPLLSVGAVRTRATRVAQLSRRVRVARVLTVSREKGSTMKTRTIITIHEGDQARVNRYIDGVSRPFVELELGDVCITTVSVEDAVRLRDAAADLVDAWVLAEVSA